MKTLYLLRHAKSDWSGGEADHERGLTRRGVDAAHRMGHFLAGVGQAPERVVSSTAKRAYLTATLAAGLHAVHGVRRSQHDATA